VNERTKYTVCPLRRPGATVLVRFTGAETLTIEEWKAERELFVKQFSVNNLFFLQKKSEI
jgi:hypothetical protein